MCVGLFVLRSYAEKYGFWQPTLSAVGMYSRGKATPEETFVIDHYIEQVGLVLEDLEWQDVLDKKSLKFLSSKKKFEHAKRCKCSKDYIYVVLQEQGKLKMRKDLLERL